MSDRKLNINLEWATDSDNESQRKQSNKRARKERSLAPTKSAGTLKICPPFSCNIDDIVDLINKAKYSIDIAVYDLSCKKLAIALLSAHSRNISIRIVTDKSYSCRNESKIPNLTNLGIKVRYPVYAFTPKINHKYCIIDSYRHIDAIYEKLQKQSKTLRIHPYMIKGEVPNPPEPNSWEWNNCYVINDVLEIFYYEHDYELLWEDV